MYSFTLKELMTFKYGKSQSGYVNPHGKYIIYGSSGPIEHTDYFLYDKESVLIGRKGTLNNPIYVNKPFWCIDTMFYSQINDKLVLPKFLFYKFLTIDFNKYNESTGVPSLRIPTLENIKVNIPNLEQQRLITNISTNGGEKYEN